MKIPITYRTGVRTHVPLSLEQEFVISDMFAFTLEYPEYEFRLGVELDIDPEKKDKLAMYATVYVVSKRQRWWRRLWSSIRSTKSG